MAEKDDCNDPVGYKKPPRRTQFQPGQSGNKKGRPKGSQNFETAIAKELNMSVEITEHGKRKKISKRQLIAKQTVNKASSGDQKATSILLNETRFHDNQNKSVVHQSALDSPEDKIVMGNIVQRIRQLNPATSNCDTPPEFATEDHTNKPPQSNEGGH